ncbi:MAG: hypothetical protein GWM87_15920, partial [Xanthomonadales bacterium]|nr:hypothetical protein [Xanthomonadales bacterium]NIX14259.1 hypothetical protein [Xanthomonadales bacterium]
RNSAGADRMQGAYLGPHFDTDSIRDFLVGRGLPFNEYPEEAMIGETVRHLAGGRVVGWFQGRMEFGPRALGNRSILGDPRDPAMQSVMNLKIKQRESFRPFAPSVLAENAHEWFELDTASPYMLLVAPVRADRRKTLTGDQKKRFGIDLLHVPRSEVPAITHVDYSARIQTVHRESNPRYHALIRQFEEATGCPMLVNTSFNIRGEPIVCTPEQAYRCFMRTEMDVLVLDRFVLLKSEQPPRADDADARVEFEP